MILGVFNFSLNETLLCTLDPKEFGFFNIINLGMDRTKKEFMSIETKEIRVTKAHSTGISRIEISPKGDLVATSADKVL